MGVTSFLIPDYPLMRLVGSMALQSLENFTTSYRKMNGYWLRPRHRIVGEAETSNPEHTGPDDNKNVPYLYSTQEALYTQFIQLKREFQLDMAEPITNLARVAAGNFTDSLVKRR